MQNDVELKTKVAAFKDELGTLRHEYSDLQTKYENRLNRRAQEINEMIIAELKIKALVDQNKIFAEKINEFELGEIKYEEEIALLKSHANTSFNTESGSNGDESEKNGENFNAMQLTDIESFFRDTDTDPLHQTVADLEKKVAKLKAKNNELKCAYNQKLVTLKHEYDERITQTKKMGLLRNAEIKNESELSHAVQLATLTVEKTNLEEEKKAFQAKIAELTSRVDSMKTELDSANAKLTVSKNLSDQVDEYRALKAGLCLYVRNKYGAFKNIVDFSRIQVSFMPRNELARESLYYTLKPLAFLWSKSRVYITSGIEIAPRAAVPSLVDLSLTPTQSLMDNFAAPKSSSLDQNHFFNSMNTNMSQMASNSFQFLLQNQFNRPLTPNNNNYGNNYAFNSNSNDNGKKRNFKRHRN